jgi:hypothetical protein
MGDRNIAAALTEVSQPREPQPLAQATRTPSTPTQVALNNASHSRLLDP